MSLREQLDLLRQPPPEGAPKPLAAAAAFADLYARGALGKAFSTCVETIGPLQRGQAVHCVSMGDWSLEHLIAHAVQQLGPMRLRLATWSVGLASLERLIRLMELGLITEVQMLLDWRVKVRTPNAYTMVRAVLPAAALRTHNMHAKVFLLDAPDWHLSYVGSANLTTNPRVEAGVLTESPAVHAFHVAWFDACMAGARPFDEPAQARMTRAD